MQKFFLMTRGRTGSTAVIDELNKCAGFRVAQELFLRYEFNSANDTKLEITKEFIPPFLLWKRRIRGSSWTPDNFLANRYLMQAENVASKSGAEVFGFKLLSHHFDENKYLCDLLLKRGYKSIYLTRNIARQVLSGMIANQRNMFNSRDDIKDPIRYLIDLKEFGSRVKWAGMGVENDKKLLREKGIAFIEVNYEYFIQKREKFYKTIFEFLNTYAELPPSSDYKIMIKDVQYTVKNYDEVLKFAEEIGIPIIH